MKRMSAVVLDIKESLTSQEHLAFLAYKLLGIKKYRTLIQPYLRTVCQSYRLAFTGDSMLMKHSHHLRSLQLIAHLNIQLAKHNEHNQGDNNGSNPLPSEELKVFALFLFHVCYP